MLMVFIRHLKEVVINRNVPMFITTVATSTVVHVLYMGLTATATATSSYSTVVEFYCAPSPSTRQRLSWAEPWKHLAGIRALSP